jgi:hypothetical protein
VVITEKLGLRQGKGELPIPRFFNLWSVSDELPKVFFVQYKVTKHPALGLFRVWRQTRSHPNSTASLSATKRTIRLSRGGSVPSMTRRARNFRSCHDSQRDSGGTHLATVVECRKPQEDVAFG